MRIIACTIVVLEDKDTVLVRVYVTILLILL